MGAGFTPRVGGAFGQVHTRAHTLLSLKFCQPPAVHSFVLCFHFTMSCLFLSTSFFFPLGFLHLRLWASKAFSLLPLRAVLSHGGFLGFLTLPPLRLESKLKRL